MSSLLANEKATNVDARAKRGSRRLKRWMVRAFIGAAMLLVASALAGAIYQAVATSHDQRAYPPPGQLVDVGESRLHINCVGEGSPTIIVEAGAGYWSAAWMGIQPEIARKAKARVCTYDRAGLGWSDRSPQARTADQVVSELHTLLGKREIASPYVLVGHSLGGYLIRIYADRYPTEIAGLVFIDSAHERQWEYLPKEVGEFVDSQVTSVRATSWMARFGMLRLMKDKLPVDKLSPKAQPAYEAAILRPEFYEVLVEEVEMGRTNAAAQAARVRSLGRIPIAVVSAKNSFEAFQPLPDNFPLEEANRKWMELQTELLRLSINSRHFISEGAHNIQLDNSQLVIDAIESVVTAARDGK